jgi:multicomponent Na+:H+ antiporter subunit A
MSLLQFMIFIPFIFSILVPFLYRVFNPRIHTGWFVLPVPVIIFLYLCQYIPKVSNGDVFIYSIPWIPTFDIHLTSVVDGLSLVFALLITGVGSLVILYSIYYLSKHREALHNFYVYILLFMGAMLGVVFSDHLFVLYVFWELTSISSFLLIAYWYQRKKSRYGALKSLLITVFGGLAMLAGFLMLSLISGTYSIREMIGQAETIGTHSLFLPAMICILLGAFTKSAQFPFSIWLPDAMEAPTPISAYLHSATMVKAGIFLVARFTPVFGGNPEWFWIISITGIITLLYGSLNAVKQTDLKALLAYSTISQLGLIMSLLGLGSISMYTGLGDESTIYAAAVFAAIFHLINHSTFKGSLFMVVGIIDHETGTRDIRRLGGLLHYMPISFTLAVIGSFSMAGIPPFNGFLSKEMFFTSVLNIAQLNIFHLETWGMLFPVIAWVASVFTFVYCMILVFKTFAGKKMFLQLDSVPHEPAIGMLIPPAILAALVIILFFIPNTAAEYLIMPAFNAILPSIAENGGLQITISPWHGFQPELFMTIGVFVIGALLYKSFKKWVRIFDSYPSFLTLNHLYDNGLEKSESFSLKLTNRYMTGSIRHYLIYIFLFFILVMGGAVLTLPGISFDISGGASINFYEAGLIICMVLAALAVLFAKSRMVALISVGALGFFVAMFFVIFRAPDLALTQLVVETVTTALFLLCFYYLPEFSKRMGQLPFKVVNFMISLGVGIIVTLLALAANGHKLFDSIVYYFENAYELAGAKNIVNAILVDFRGIDTMLEISVLCIAGLGVYTLIKLKMGGDKNETK